jgi:hypothetical protein
VFGREGSSRTSDENMSKWTSKRHFFFEVMPEVQKDPEDVFAGIGKKNIY